MTPSRLPSSVVRFGVFEFDHKSEELLKRGRRVRLSGQPAKILSLLLQRPGELVTREELRQSLWPAEVHVNFEQSLNAAIKRLRNALGDSPERSVFIETMARRGYRFIAPANAAGSSGVPLPRPIRAVQSIAALPFENTTADPDAEYLVDGLTESLIHALSRLPDLRVLARSAVFRYRGKAVDSRTLGRRLNVDALLLGRVSQRGDELMVAAELVDADNGFLIWGEQFNRRSSDILVIEAELSSKTGRVKRVSLICARQFGIPPGSLINAGRLAPLWHVP